MPASANAEPIHANTPKPPPPRVCTIVGSAVDTAVWRAVQIQVPEWWRGARTRSMAERKDETQREKKTSAKARPLCGGVLAVAGRPGWTVCCVGSSLNRVRRLVLMLLLGLKAVDIEAATEAVSRG